MQSKKLRSGAGCGFRWLILLIVVLVACESVLAGKAPAKKKGEGAKKKTGAVKGYTGCPDCKCNNNDYNPVCCSNGRVYPNECRFLCAKNCRNPTLTIQYKFVTGVCEELPCYPQCPP